MLLDFDKNKVLHNKNEIINESIKSKPGRGITGTEKAKIEIRSTNRWPKKINLSNLVV